MSSPLDLMSALSPEGGGLPEKGWLSVATVDDEDPVTFDPDLGPLVNVTAQPNQTPVVCRVGMRIAGRGEAEYFPFAAGDEVLIAILRGDARAGGVILCRLCNGIDRFPESVAGQDATANKFGFTRSIAPHLEERNGPIVWRQGTTGAFVSIGAEGNVTLRDGSKAALQLSASVLGLQSGDGRFVLQLDAANGRFNVASGDALLVLSASSADPERSALAVPGAFVISTASNPAAEHAISTEAAVNLIAQLLLQIGVAFPGPLTGAALAASVVTLLPAVLQAAAQAPLLPQISAAIVAAFQAAGQKPPGVPSLGQARPGIGCPGLFLG